MHHDLDQPSFHLEAEEDRWIDGLLSVARAATCEYSSIDEAISEVAEQAGTLFIQSFPNFFDWEGELTFPRRVTDMIRAEMRARLTDSVRVPPHPIDAARSSEARAVGPL